MNLFLKKMKPIKICFVSLYAYHYFNPKIISQIGGAELQLYYLATELAKDPRFDTHFLVGDFGQSDFEIRKNVKLYNFFKPQKGLKYIRAIFGFFRLWKLLKKINADIYIQRAAGLETGEVALFCKLNKKKFIYMVSNDEDVENKKPIYFPRGLMGWLRWELFKFGLKNTHLVFVQNENQKKILKKNYNKEGVIRKSGQIISEKLKEKTVLPKTDILWVGKSDKEIKQPEIFIDLTKEFPDEKFIMICPEANDKNYFKKIKKEALKLSNLKFIEFVSFDKVDDYFQKAKIFINTSKTEGFPNTFIQAAKNKTPILSLNINPDGLLENYNIGCCANGDFEKLKTELKKLLENKNLWREMSENAYRYARENHDLRKIILKDKELLIQLWYN